MESVDFFDQCDDYTINSILSHVDDPMRRAFRATSRRMRAIIPPPAPMNVIYLLRKYARRGNVDQFAQILRELDDTSRKDVIIYRRVIMLSALKGPNNKCMFTLCNFMHIPFELVFDDICKIHIVPVTKLPIVLYVKIRWDIENMKQFILIDAQSRIAFDYLVGIADNITYDDINDDISLHNSFSIMLSKLYMESDDDYHKNLIFGLNYKHLALIIKIVAYISVAKILRGRDSITRTRAIGNIWKNDLDEGLITNNDVLLLPLHTRVKLLIDREMPLHEHLLFDIDSFVHVIKQSISGNQCARDYISNNLEKYILYINNTHYSQLLPCHHLYLLYDWFDEIIAWHTKKGIKLNRLWKVMFCLSSRISLTEMYDVSLYDFVGISLHLLYKCHNEYFMRFITVCCEIYNMKTTYWKQIIYFIWRNYHRFIHPIAITQHVCNCIRQHHVIIRIDKVSSFEHALIDSGKIKIIIDYCNYEFHTY